MRYFPKERLAVFVDGCFWHGCPIHSNPAKWLKKSSMGPGKGLGDLRSAGVRGRETGAQQSTTTGRDACATSGKRGGRTGKVFWAKKMAGNIARDRFVNRELRKAGWRVIRIWEHGLTKARERCVQRIRRAVLQGSA
jgi:DNA mismatch endonuclease (patch repair protein)